jgi:hypothetical protein
LSTHFYEFWELCQSAQMERGDFVFYDRFLELCRRKGIDPSDAALIPMEEYRRQQFDILADGVRGALDMDAVYAAMGMERR